MATIRLEFTPEVTGITVHVDDALVDWSTIENSVQIQRRINRVCIEFEGTVTMTEELVEAKAKP